MIDYGDDAKVVVSTKTMNYTIETQGPNNFYFIKPSKGFAPKELKGAFTTIDAAQKAISNYLARQGKETK